MKQLLIIVLSVLLLIPAGKRSGNLRFKQSAETPVENSHAVKKAAFRQQESNSKTKEAIANGLPQVEGSLSYSRMGLPEISISEEKLEALPDEISPLLSGLSDIKSAAYRRSRSNGKSMCCTAGRISPG
jgi:outer membrane protein TolC